jgi:hypothetical protein
MKTNSAAWVKIIPVVALGFYLTCCANNSTPVAEAEYSTKIVGHWQGTVGNLQETMSLAQDGTFVCQLQPTGFISTMIFPHATGEVSGTWKISGTIVTLRITDEKNESLANQMASSTIVAFTSNKLTLKSDRGGTSSFQRVDNL